MPPQKAMVHFPSISVLLKLVWKRKIWNGTYNGDLMLPSFGSEGWKRFVDDNELDVGDMIVFEILKADVEEVELKVVLFKGPFDPPEELEKIRKAGTSQAHAIEIE